MKKNYVAIIESGGANFRSVQSAFDRLNVNTVITSDMDIIKSAQAVVLPGVGASGYAMNKLNNKNLADKIRELTQPVLGICLGQQLLCAFSEEDNTECLNIMPMQVKKLKDTKIIPHMGWNNLINLKINEPLLQNLSEEDNFYFSHSFGVELSDQYTLGICEYGLPFSAVIKHHNFYGVQFHPEKSGESGVKLLKNFLKLSNLLGEV